MSYVRFGSHVYSCCTYKIIKLTLVILYPSSAGERAQLLLNQPASQPIGCPLIGQPISQTLCPLDYMIRHTLVFGGGSRESASERSSDAWSNRWLSSISC